MTILKIDEGRTQTNRLKDKEIYDSKQGLTTETDYMYQQKKEESRLPSIEDCVDESIYGLEEYI